MGTMKDGDHGEVGRENDVLPSADEECSALNLHICCLLFLQNLCIVHAQEEHVNEASHLAHPKTSPCLASRKHLGIPKVQPGEAKSRPHGPLISYQQPSCL